MIDKTELRLDFLELMVSPLADESAPEYRQIVTQARNLWSAVTEGLIPYGTVVVPYESDVTIDGVKRSEDIAFALVLSPTFARAAFCLVRNGKLLTDQLDVLILADGVRGTANATDTHCPIDERIADAQATDAALAAIARGETPVFDDRDVAASCGVARKPEHGMLDRGLSLANMFLSAGRSTRH